MGESERKTVLVVDDDPGIRFPLVLKLRGAGFDVCEATDGEEALQSVKERPVDLAIVDVGMPRMDGYTLCERFRAEPTTAALPVIILTAQDLGVPADVAARIGEHRFLTKPFSPRQLVKEVEELLRGGGGD
ncbi:MAG: response regulator [Planctomycetota bacterium]